MAVRASDNYAGTVRISRQRFGEVLRQFASPAVLNERAAEDYYDAILTYRTADGRVLDPLFVLAMFQHESSMGDAGVAIETHSWGNTRAPNFGATPVGMHPRGFPIWANWLDGLRSTAARLVTDDWYYGFERRNIAQVFNDPVADNPAYRPAMQPVPRTPKPGGGVWRVEWAPSYDSNDPASYLGAMLAFMNRYQDMGDVGMPTRLIDMYSHTPIIDSNQKLSWAQILVLPNFPDTRLRQFKYVTVHETANPNVGANAQMHRNFVAGGGGAARVSFQWTVDSERIIQITDVDVACWHAGDGGGAGNFESNGIEMCVNSDGDYMRTLYNTAYLIANLQIDHGVAHADKVQHNHWSQKNCPAQMRARNLWDWFRQGIADWEAKLSATSERTFDTVPWVLRGDIKRYWEGLESLFFPGTSTQIVWLTLGYPQENETIRPVALEAGQPPVELWTQRFQRGWVIIEPNEYPWNMHHAFTDQFQTVVIQPGPDGEWPPEALAALGSIAEHRRESVELLVRLTDLNDADLATATAHEQE